QSGEGEATEIPPRIAEVEQQALAAPEPRVAYAFSILAERQRAITVALEEIEIGFELRGADLVIRENGNLARLDLSAEHERGITRSREARRGAAQPSNVLGVWQ